MITTTPPTAPSADEAAAPSSRSSLTRLLNSSAAAGAPRTTAKREQQREVVEAFVAAAREGDFEGLLEVLDPDVTWRSYTPRGTIVHLGVTEVMAAAERGKRAAIVPRRVLVKGEPGGLFWGRGGKPVSVMSCTVADGRIVDVVTLVDPVRLAAMDLPAPPPQG